MTYRRDASGMARHSRRRRTFSGRRRRERASPGVVGRGAALAIAAAALTHAWLPGAAAASLGEAASRTTVGAGVAAHSTAMEPERAGGAVELYAHAITDHPLARLRELYYAAVEDREAIAAAMDEIAALRDAGMARTGSRRASVLDAYVGALTTLRAKHGRWPPDRLRNLHEGLDRLDRAVADAPDVVEIRYLRLMSCYYLPGILGRGASVQDDFDALTRLLPDAPGEFPPQLYRAIVSFVVEHADLDAADRAALESAIRTSHTDSG